MNANQRRIYTALSAALLALAAGSASAIELEQVPNTNPQQVAQVATRSLDLQPGDEQLIEQALKSPLRFEQIPGEQTFTGQLIVHAKAGKAQRASDRISPLRVKSSAFVEEYVIDVPKGMSEGELAAILMATGDYEFVEPNWTLYPTVIPNDPQYGSSWQHTRIQSASAWDLHTGNSNIIVAICDSGVDDNHPDLQASLVLGYNSANNLAEIDGGLVDDINGHGTFVAGCAAARGNNSTGVVGVGWNFSIMPIRVTNNTNGTASGFDLLEGARWAAENGAQIVNVSFSGGTSASNQSTGAYLKSLGSLMFWASGNSGTSVSPNRPDYVLVGSTTSSDNRSGFSNFGPALDLVAPGSSVRSTQRGGWYGNSSGTSYASPIAAGVGAMIYSVNPSFSADDVQAILYSSVDDLGAPGRDDFFGRGRVNTRNAIEQALTYVPPTLMPIAESFESNDWQNLFLTTIGSAGTTTDPQAPDGSEVLVLNNNDVIETVPLAGRSLGPGTDAVLSMMIKSQSVEPGEELEIQYLENPETLPNTWTTLRSITGQGLSASEFVAHDIILPADYEWHGVKLQLAANGSDAGDTWLVDAFILNVLGDPVAPLEENFESEFISGVRWDDVQGAQVAIDDNNFFVELANNDLIESRDIPLAEFGIVPAFIRFDAWVDAQVLDDDELLVEVFNIAELWETVETIPASDLSTNPGLIELNMPFTAIGIDELRVRFSANTAGAFRIDNIYVGVDELVGGCNAADFAEPFGDLNFFDISEFLTVFSAGDFAADINNDGVLNFFDISEFLTIFSNGCP